MPSSHNLRALPSVDSLLRTEAARALLERTGAKRLTTLARAVTEELRAEMRAATDDAAVAAAHHDGSRATLLAEAARRLERAVEGEAAKSLRRVINATGVVLHTNLGRAPLSEAARRAVADEAAALLHARIRLASGARGRRGGRVEEVLAELTGAEDAARRQQLRGGGACSSSRRSHATAKRSSRAASWSRSAATFASPT